MKRIVSIIIGFILSLSIQVFFHALPVHAADGGWMQNDWSGGPGQSQWADESRYESSSRVDTMSDPGSMRISFLADKYSKYPFNPVLPQGPAGSWDEGQVSGFPRRRDDGGYEMVYRGSDAAGIRALGYASSPDPLNWAKYAGNPVIERNAANAWEQDGVGSGPMVEMDGIYHRLFRGYPPPGSSNYYGHATSTDLMNWTRESDFVLGPGPAGSWDESLEFVTDAAVNSSFSLWYLGEDAANVWQVGYATSPDGVNWTKDPSNPVLTVGAPGSWDESGIWWAEVVERPWLGDYLMAYSASDNVGNSGIGTATSPDGVSWTKNPGNPLFISGAPNWFQSFIDIAECEFDGSIYKLYLYGADGAGLYHSGEAWSDDGEAWWMNSHNPILSPSSAPAWDESFIFSAEPFIEGNILRLFYIGLGPAHYAVGTATTDPSYCASGTLVSSVFDAGAVAEWMKVQWDELTPAGTSVKVEVRGGITATPDASWSEWAQVTNGGSVPHDASRYIQYRLTLSTTDGTMTPVVSRIVFNMPIDLIPNKYDFETADTISVTADIIPISTPFFPFVRIIMPDNQTLYYVSGVGFVPAPTPYLSGGPSTLPSAISGYSVLNVPFSAVAPGTYYLEGGAVDANQTTSVNNIVYIGTIDRETLTVQ